MPSTRWFQVGKPRVLLNKSFGKRGKKWESGGSGKFSFSIDKFTRERERGWSSGASSVQRLRFNRMEGRKKNSPPQPNRDECRRDGKTEEKKKKERKRKQSICRVVASRWLLVGQVDAWLWDLGCLIYHHEMSAPYSQTLFHFYTLCCKRIFLSYSLSAWNMFFNRFCLVSQSVIFHFEFTLHSPQLTHQKHL